MLNFLEKSCSRINLLYNNVTDITNILDSLSKGFQFRVEIYNTDFLINELCEQRKLVEEVKQLTLFLLNIEQLHNNIIEKQIDQINNYIGYGVLEHQCFQLEITNLHQLIKVPLRSLSITNQHDTDLQTFFNILEQKIDRLKDQSYNTLAICHTTWTDNIEMFCVLQIVNNIRWDIRIDILIQINELIILQKILNILLEQ